MQPLRILAAIFFLAAIGTCAGAIGIYNNPGHQSDSGIMIGLCIVSAACALCSAWIAITLFKSNEK